MVEKNGRVTGCFGYSSSTSVVLQQCQNQESFQRNEFCVLLKFFLIILKG